VKSATDLSVVRAQLPYLDRRALSEAWFSALHVAAAADPPRGRPLRLAGLVSDGRAPVVPAPARYAGTLLGRRRSTAPRAPSAGFGAHDLRSNGSRRTRLRTAPSPHPASYPSLRASFTLGLDGARVQILMRREGATLHVIALCTRRHVELVRRALACADVHLRAQGERLFASVRGIEAGAR